MKTNRAVLTAVVIVLVVAAGFWMFRRGSAERVDLLAAYDQAEKKGGTFSIATIARPSAASPRRRGPGERAYRHVGLGSVSIFSIFATRLKSVYSRIIAVVTPASFTVMSTL